MKPILLSMLMILMAAANAIAEDRAPAGYLVTLKLAGADAASKEVVIRNGGEIAGKLMMPLYDGDVVFVRDPASSIGVELGDGTTMTLGRGLARFKLKGEIDTGDGTLGILAAIAGVFAGEGEQAPENMAAKGSSLRMPMAVRGANLIRKDRNGLWLGWQGGTAPFSVSISTGGENTLLLKDVRHGAVTVPLAGVTIGKFTIIINDAEQQKLQLRFRRVDALPENLPVTGTSQASFLARAAWLTSQEGWRIEAAQMLHEAGTDTALALRDKIVGGWTYQP